MVCTNEVSSIRNITTLLNHQLSDKKGNQKNNLKVQTKVKNKI